ncbi:unnamed protein product [marine sediment metagenome]|uniref:Uncharacterized protein n=1 Tax=marine sediment metagenome TaxID=412755 RepID=X1I646_9ZZZZ
MKKRDYSYWQLCIEVLTRFYPIVQIDKREIMTQVLNMGFAAAIGVKTGLFPYFRKGFHQTN